MRNSCHTDTESLSATYVPCRLQISGQRGLRQGRGTTGRSRRDLNPAAPFQQCRYRAASGIPQHAHMHAVDYTTQPPVHLRRRMVTSALRQLPAARQQTVRSNSLQPPLGSSGTRTPSVLHLQRLRGLDARTCTCSLVRARAPSARPRMLFEPVSLCTRKLHAEKHFADDHGQCA